MRVKLTSIERKGEKIIDIAGRKVGAGQPVFIVTEIGINHNGDLKIAKRLIDAAAEAGADCAKFQMRNLKTLYGDFANIGENLTTEYTKDLLSRFELSENEMFAAFDYCKKRCIMPLCTPWDLESLKKLEAYGMDAYKVASCDMTNHGFLRELVKTRKPLIISTGMSEEREIKETVALLKKLGAQFILLHCNSTYPAPFKDLRLNYLHRLQKIGRCPVGYSGHERGFHIPIAAVAMGAKLIEKHITLDRNMEGSDHKASLLPNEFKQMVGQIRQVEEALGSASARHMTQGERMNRVNLAKSIVAKRNINIGQKITEDVLSVKSPGRGLQPNRLSDLVGIAAKRDFKAGDFFFPSDLKGRRVVARRYRFRRPWGLPVRYHDFGLTYGTNPDFVEFHLSYKDLELDARDFLDGQYDMGLVVHSPDLFAGDHLLDLASSDEAYRNRSIEELQRVVNKTRELKRYFKHNGKTLIIASLGGFSRDGFCKAGEKAEMYERIAKSLSRVDRKGVEIIGQTLPPFPWYFGGQGYLNLFVDPEETARFCARHKIRLCLDISHAKLACNQLRWPFEKYIDTLASYTAHMHIADASGVDGEGLQVGEGEIDFEHLARHLGKILPNVSFIPEVWQGHENVGEGFWVALEKLEKVKL